MTRRKNTSSLLFFACFLWAGRSVALEPWAAPGDLALRHDVQVLADARVIRTPITTWPLSWPGIAADVLSYPSPGELSPAGQAAFRRLLDRARIRSQADIERHLRVALAENPYTLRDFADTPRDSAEVAARMAWTGARLTYRLQATIVNDPADGEELRGDGSYLGVTFGNWMVSAGWQERWWGPGWQGSLLLSSNARPLPSLALDRKHADPFETKWLSWIGPWSVHAVMGQLESDRVVPNALLFALRFAFKPLPSLEVGLARSAQWCGDERPCRLDTFVDLLLGNDNREQNVSTEDEPGNQLGGMDFRWAPARWNGRVAWYGQLIGEDETSKLPNRFMGLTGLEWSAYSPRLQRSVRVHLEAADTAAEFFDEPLPDVAYEHSIYRSGYRYRGRALGHTIDSDSRLFSLGLLLLDDREQSWRFLAQGASLKRIGVKPNTLTDGPADLFNLRVDHTRPLGLARLELSLGYQYFFAESARRTSQDIQATANLTWGL